MGYISLLAIRKSAGHIFLKPWTTPKREVETAKMGANQSIMANMWGIISKNRKVSERTLGIPSNKLYQITKKKSHMVGSSEKKSISNFKSTG